MNKQAIVFWSYKSGLANRLRALVGYETMSHYLGKDFYLCWNPGPACDAKFEELFDTSNIKLISEKQKQTMEADGVADVYEANPWYFNIWEKYVKDEVSWRSFCKESLTYLSKLKPLSKIVNKVEQFSASQRLEDTLGVHIRMTDNLDTYEDWKKSNLDFELQKVSKLSGFESVIADYLNTKSSASIFLATDNENVENHISSLHPGRVILYAKNYRKGEKKVFLKRQFTFDTQLQRTSSIEDALVEMLLLSKCHSIVGTYFSSYSKFSAVMGDKKYYEMQGSQCVESDFVLTLQGHAPN